MENNIGVGLIVGLTFASSLYVWNNEKFSKEQKAVLLVLLIFPPAQWLGILIVLAFNSYTINNSTEKRKTKKINNSIDDSISNLTYLKDKGILTNEECKLKVDKLEVQKAEEELKNSIEYKQLQSLLEDGILTKEEFESKVELIDKVKPPIKIEVKTTEIGSEDSIKERESFLPYFIVAVIAMVITILISLYS